MNHDARFTDHTRISHRKARDVASGSFPYTFYFSLVFCEIYGIFSCIRHLDAVVDCSSSTLRCAGKITPNSRNISVALNPVNKLAWTRSVRSCGRKCPPLSNHRSAPTLSSAGFPPSQLVNATNDSLTFRVPNNIYQFWIESNHMTALQTAITDVCGGPRTVKFSSPSPAGSGEEDVILSSSAR